MKYIKLFEDINYSMYDTLLLNPEEAGVIVAREISKSKPNIELIENIIYYSPLDINGIVGKDKRTFLYAATMYERIKVVELFLKHPDIDPNKQVEYLYTPLMEASERNDKLVKLFLQHPKTNVNIQNYWGDSAIVIAAKWEKTECVRLLLEVPEINPNTQNSENWTALMHAAYGGYREIVELLLYHPSINIRLKNKSGLTAWDLIKPSIRGQFPQLNPNFR
jgi:ankyrin repeat protein